MRFSTCDARLRNSAIHVAYSREPQSMRHMRPRFHNPCGIYGRVSVIYIMQQYILQKYTKFRLIHFGSVSNCQYRSIQAQVSFFQLSTIAALYKKAQGCAEGRGLVPLCGFLTFQCDLPSAGFRSLCAIQPEFRNLCGIYGGVSAIHAAYTAEIPQSMRPFGRGLRSPCGYYFPIQNLENISLTRSSPSDSPRIRPRLSYASVRSME